MSLEAYFEYTFGMVQHHNWVLTEIENMLPWERHVYTQKLLQHIEDEKQRQRDQEQRMKHR